VQQTAGLKMDGS